MTTNVDIETILGILEKTRLARWSLRIEGEFAAQWNAHNSALIVTSTIPSLIGGEYYQGVHEGAANQLEFDRSTLKAYINALQRRFSEEHTI